MPGGQGRGTRGEFLKRGQDNQEFVRAVNLEKEERFVEDERIYREVPRAPSRQCLGNALVGSTRHAPATVRGCGGSRSDNRPKRSLPSRGHFKRC